MQREIIATYTDIMTRLTTLPDEIAAAQTDLNAAKMQLSASEKTLEDIEAQTALNVEGKNAEERKARLAATLKVDAVYVRWSKAAATERQDVARLSNDVAALTNHFAAAGYMARLHAGLMNFLAASGAVTPDGDMQFYKRTNGTNGNGNGHVTAADAAADFGL
jgi:hypothetical protein